MRALALPNICTSGALCLSSKVLSRAATPFLYRHFSNNPTDDGCPMRSFVLTACASPAIAKHIQSVHIFGSTKIDEDSFTNRELELMTARLSAILASNLTAFYQIAGALAAGCVTAQAVVLLSAATQMEHFMYLPAQLDEQDAPTLCCIHCQFRSEWLRAIFSSAEAPSAYKRLRDVGVEGGWLDNEIEGSSDLAMRHPVLDILGLSAIRKLQLRRFYTEALAPRNVVPAPGSQLDYVHLHDVDLGSDDIKAILNSTTSLSVLNIAWKVPPYAEGDSEYVLDFDPEVMLSVLRASKHHLKGLRLVNIADSGLLLRRKPALGSLADFETLLTLKVDERLLRGAKSWDQIDLANILPPSLEQLTIHSNAYLDDLGPICTAVSSAADSQLQNVDITFDQGQDEDQLYAECRTLAQINLTVYDVAYFNTSEMGQQRQLLCFSCRARHASKVLAEFADLLAAEHGDQVVHYMTHYQKELVCWEDYPVFLPGFREYLEDLEYDLWESERRRARERG